MNVTRGAMTLVLTCGLVVPASAATQEGADGDRILQAAREAILDGRLDDAERLLETADVRLDEVDAALLRGIVALQRGETETATLRFEEVVAAEPDRGVAWIYLAHARLARERFQGALDALDAAGSLAEEISGVTLLRVRALEGLGQLHRALATLEAALDRFPDDPELHEEHVFFFLRAGLSAAAADAARSYREVARSEARAWVLLAAAYRLGRRNDEAVMVLEEAHLRFPGAHEVGEQLAYTYALRRRPVAAARLYEALTYAGGAHAFAVADQLRLAGDYDRALHWNARVEDEGERLDQRLAILVGQERFSRAVVVGELADAQGVLKDTSLYTLGYAAVLAGRGELARELSKRLREAGRTESADRLNALIARCRDEPWLCR